MLFKNDELNSYKYDFETEIDNKLFEYSFKDVCKELNVFTQKISWMLSNNIKVETNIKDRNGNQYSIDTKSILNDSSFIFNRTSEDIYRIIVSKNEFRKNLEKIGFKEPSTKNDIDFVIYLKAIYLFYIMIYFIFPKVKFYDLYDEKNISSENTLEANTGNEIYEQFIKDAIYQNKLFKKMESYRERNYNKAIKEYSKAFFSLFEIEYYRFIKMPFSGSKKMFEDSLSQKNIDSFIEHFENLYKENVFVSDLNDVASDNILDEYIDYINSIQTRAVLIDFQKSLEILKPYIDTLSKKKIDYHIPESFKTIKIYADDLFNVLNDDEDFIRTVMNTSKLSNTIKDKYYSYDFVDAIDGIWEFERGQRENYGSDAFLFLKKYKEYYMSKYDLALICITFKNLELNVNYISNRTYLNNRSDGQKKNTHSIKRSYGTKKQGNFDASLSTLRDGIFRIICRMTYLKVSNGNYNEFIYYEYPMNLLNNKYMLVIEKYKSLKLKTSIYQVLAETMNDY